MINVFNYEQIKSCLTAKNMPTQEEIEAIVEPFTRKKSNLNLVVGIIDKDSQKVDKFGQFQENSPAPPREHMLFEIGSITKVFTATLLSILVENQELELQAPVSSLLPEYKNLPEHITLESLVTHTSGLPRLPANFIKVAKKNADNPYADYTVDHLNEYLRNYTEKGATFGQISYSNLGAGLLGHVLARYLDLSYEDAIITRICNPLGLKNTRITLTDEQRARLAIARSPQGKPVSNWDLPTLAGAGALRSDADDLLKFLSANLKPAQTPWESAINQTHKLRCDQFPPPGAIPKLLSQIGKLWQRKSRINQKEIGIALGWFIIDLPGVDQRIYWHNGGTGGYRSSMSFVKETGTGVVVLCNYGYGIGEMLGQYSVDTIGLKILAQLHS